MTDATAGSSASTAGTPTREAIDRTAAILADLVAIPSVSGRPNADIFDLCAGHLTAAGATVERDTHPDGQRSNLFATFGPAVPGGVALSGHMDVVPADRSGWSSDPFQLTSVGDRLVGRGAVDMKGFLAMVLASAPAFGAAAQAGRLTRPIQVIFTFDEETSSYGAAHLVPFLEAHPARPATVIVGEPTRMVPIVGHKAGIEVTTVFHGRAGHASKPRDGCNAIDFACRFVARLNAVAAARAAAPAAGSPFDPPYTTLNVGRISGGEARNVIADTCRIDWEVRPLPEDDGLGLVTALRAFAEDELLPEMRSAYPDAAVTFPTLDHYPGLEPRTPSPALDLVRQIWPAVAAPEVVSFGTDGCYFQAAGLSTVVIGPGDLSRAHLPDEFITRDELATGLMLMSNLVDFVCAT